MGVVKKHNAQVKLYEALVTLSKIKPIREIQVSELCRKAHVNRSTFYHYYEDIHHLIKQETTETLAQLMNILKDKRLDPTRINVTDEQTIFVDYQTVLLILQEVKAEHRLFPVLLQDHNDSAFYFHAKQTLYDLLAYLLDRHLEQFRQLFSEIPKAYIDIVLFDVQAESILYWIKTGMVESPAEIARLLLTYNKMGPLRTIASFNED
ncbi:TetR-like C-terminal domain-containing protein [uncultured Enterococcus sp.]|uniref:TetR-like C-terminal domain-containing protein n=1 Tax=uncultured Enterococcus sp. TaxID=167972 RepID=UPI0025F4EED6|nr:TetR/AcrR family transcriptional regulator [uncultured Enterococcus sp.]